MKKYKPRHIAPRTIPGQRVRARWVAANNSWSFYGLDINEAAYLREHFQKAQKKRNDPRPVPRIRDTPEALHGVRDTYMEAPGRFPDANAAVAALLDILEGVMHQHERKFGD